MQKEQVANILQLWEGVSLGRSMCSFLCVLAGTIKHKVKMLEISGNKVQVWMNFESGVMALYIPGKIL